MTVEKKRIEVLLTKSFLDALDYLVEEEEIYFDKQDVIRDALRRLFRAQGIPPFYPQEDEG